MFENQQDDFIDDKSSDLPINIRQKSTNGPNQGVQRVIREKQNLNSFNGRNEQSFSPQNSSRVLNNAKSTLQPERSSPKGNSEQPAFLKSLSELSINSSNNKAKNGKKPQMLNSYSPPLSPLNPQSVERKTNENSLLSLNSEDKSGKYRENAHFNQQGSEIIQDTFQNLPVNKLYTPQSANQKQDNPRTDSLKANQPTNKSRSPFSSLISQGQNIGNNVFNNQIQQQKQSPFQQPLQYKQFYEGGQLNITSKEVNHNDKNSAFACAMRALQQKIRDQQSQIQELQNSQENDKHYLKELINSHQVELSEKDQEIEELKMLIQLKGKEHEDILQTLEAAEMEKGSIFERMESELSSLNLTLQETKNKLNKSKAELISERNGNSILEEEVNRLKQDLQASKHQVLRLQAEQHAHTEENQDLIRKLGGEKAAREEQHLRYESRTLEIQKLKESFNVQLREFQTEVGVLESNYSKRINELDSKNSQLVENVDELNHLLKLKNDEVESLQKQNEQNFNLWESKRAAFLQKQRKLTEQIHVLKQAQANSTENSCKLSQKTPSKFDQSKSESRRSSMLNDSHPLPTFPNINAQTSKRSISPSDRQLNYQTSESQQQQQQQHLSSIPNQLRSISQQSQQLAKSHNNQLHYEEQQIHQTSITTKPIKLSQIIQPTDTQSDQSGPFHRHVQEERQVDPYFGGDRQLQIEQNQDRYSYLNGPQHSSSNMQQQFSENEEGNLNISDNSMLFNQYISSGINGVSQSSQQHHQQNKLNLSQLNHNQSLDQSGNSNIQMQTSNMQNHLTSIQSNHLQLNTLNQTTLNTTSHEANDKYDFILRQIIDVEKDSINLNNQFKTILEESGTATDSKVKHQLRGRLIELNEQISKNNQKLFALKRKEQDYMDQIN